MRRGRARIAAPRPTLGLTVAIVGHRPERIEDAKAVRGRIDAVLTRIDAALAAQGSGDGYRPEPCRPRLVSALAEGADRIAAEAALAGGWSLDAVLPFPADEYQSDFGDAASRDAFRSLLDRAGSVLVLDGPEAVRERAYDAVGLALLDNADLLIAVWDGEAGRGRGGTREVIEEATRRGLPLVTLPPDGGEGALRTAGAGAGPLRLEDTPSRPLAELDALIARIVARPSDAGGSPDWDALTHPPRAPLVHGVYPLLLTLTGVGRRRGPRTADEPGPAPEPLEAAFAWWDASAVTAAQAFRSAVIVNFGLAALSVVLAAGSVLAGAAKPLLVVAEVVAILLLLANATVATRRRWQERWLESRQLAELLRVARLLRQVGLGRGMPDGGGVIGWHARAMARAAAPLHLDLSDAAEVADPVVAEIAAQAAWNRATAHRMHLAAHRIERFGELLFVLVLAAALGWLGLYLARPEMAHGLQYPLIAVTAGLPAMATASYGIRVILDFEGIADRARRIAEGLEGLLMAWKAGPRDAAALQRLARGASDVMLGDVAAWRLLAEGRRLTIPG